MMRGSAPGERRGGRQKGTPNKPKTNRVQELQQSFESEFGGSPTSVQRVLIDHFAIMTARFETAAADPKTKPRDLLLLEKAATEARASLFSAIAHVRQKAKEEAAKAKAIATKAARAAQASNGNGTPITELEMSAHARIVLTSMGINTVEELLQLPVGDPLRERVELRFSLADCPHLSASDVLKGRVICFKPPNWRAAALQDRIEVARLRHESLANDPSQLVEQPEVQAEPDLEPDLEPVQQETQAVGTPSPEPPQPARPANIHDHPFAPVKKFGVFP